MDCMVGGRRDDLPCAHSTRMVETSYGFVSGRYDDAVVARKVLRLLEEK